MPSSTTSMTDTTTAPRPAIDGSRRTDALALVRLGRKAASAYGRADLAARLDGLIERLEQQRVTVVVMGEFKAGKSSLVNALVAADVCPVDVDVATAVPTVVEYADEPVVEVMCVDGDGNTSAVVVSPSEASSWIRGEHEGTVGVRIGLPRRLLADGFVVIDTPGVGGLDARHVAQSLGVLTSADVVLFATDGANELGGPTLELLALVRGLVTSTELVLTKSDLSHHIDDVAAADVEHLTAASIDVGVHVVSSELRARAIVSRDADLDDESGLPALLTRLRSVGAGADDRAALAAAAAVTDVSQQLREVFTAERQAIIDGANQPSAIGPATPASGSWQQLLGDEITDFSSDLEFVLRRRSRDLMAEAEAALVDGDPDELWPEVSAWLAERAAADVVSTFSTLRERTTLIATRVAERFELSGEGSSPIDTATLDELVDQVLASLPERAAIGATAASKTTSGLNAFRSTFYAFTMFSTVGALIGVAAAPAALVLGLVIGGKSMRDERVKTRQQRRTQAKSAVRTYLDEVAFIAGKESRDALRLVQRALRDHFTMLAAERQRTLAEAAAAAKRAAEADVESRRRRLADVDAELGRLETLSARAAAFAASMDGGSV
jgi:hypothetical protein